MGSACELPCFALPFPVTTNQKDSLLAKPNYQYEKRQKDLAKNKKQEEKRQKKAEKNNAPPVDAPESPSEPEQSDVIPNSENG